MDDKYRDASLEVLQKTVDFYGATRFLSNLINTKMSLSDTKCQVTERCALVVVARVVLVPGRRHKTVAISTGQPSPYVALLMHAKT